MVMPKRMPRDDGMLLCPGCQTFKRPDEFGHDKYRWDGLTNSCKGCRRESWLRTAARVGPEKLRQWQRGRVKRSNGPHQQAWRDRNLDRVRMLARAGQIVKRALLRGELVRPDACEECGRTGVPIEAAHKDYARPLDVRWLCRFCHRLWDSHEPKSKTVIAATWGLRGEEYHPEVQT